MARNTFGLVARPGEVFEGPDAVIQHGVFRETSERNIARIANAVLATLFKGHNVIVNIVVLNCQCLKCQVSAHKFLGLLFEGDKI